MEKYVDWPSVGPLPALARWVFVGCMSVVSAACVQPEAMPADGGGLDAVGDVREHDSVAVGPFDSSVVIPDATLVDGGQELPDTMVGDAGGPDVLAPFVYTTTCKLPVDPPGNSEVTLVDAFPALPSDALSYPMGLADPNDGTGRLFVYERFGSIKSFQNDPATTSIQSVLNIGSKLFTGGEGGLLGMALHPKFAENGHVFLNYTVKENGDIYTIIGRFTVDALDPAVFDAGSEHQILKIFQPFSNHNGGEIKFGPDAYLYVGMGDGGAGGDPYGHGQDLTTRLGAMLRIDVDQPTGGNNYGIPSGNPFALGGGPEAPEIWAWGLRNPWRFSFDSLTGQLWVGDVGQKAWEEINVVEGGKNYGWNTMEGLVCYPIGSSCDPSGFTPPVLQYPTTGKGSVTGGYVYRGTKTPSLYGTYIFADYEQASIWFFPTAESPPDAPAMTPPTKVAGFGQDAAGEVYVMGLLNGTIYRFEQAKPAAPSDPFPQTLSSTGCFVNMDSLAPVAGVLPYDIQVPFWSDGARKARYMVLPEGGKVAPHSDHRWSVPEGTIFIKHFFLDGEAPASPATIRVETRFLVMRDAGVQGYVYRWNDAGTEATLIESGESRAIPQVGPDGAPFMQIWQFPARHQCVGCHTEETGGVLGLETRQLNIERLFAGGVVNQIDRWTAWGLVSPALPVGSGANLPTHPALDDESVDLEKRARAWLHVNCSGCHAGPAGTGMDMDLRLATSFLNTQTCNVAPQKGDLGTQGAQLIQPGSPEASVLYRRAYEPGSTRMPPLGSSVIDGAGTQLLHAWIQGLDACPAP